MLDLFHDTRLSRRQHHPGHRTRESIRDLGYEQLPRQQRSLLDGGLSRRNLVLRYPTREYEPDHASRTRQACRPLSRATAANQRRPDGQLLTSAPPYEPEAAASGEARGGAIARHEHASRRDGLQSPVKRDRHHPGEDARTARPSSRSGAFPPEPLPPQRMSDRANRRRENRTWSDSLPPRSECRSTSRQRLLQRSNRSSGRRTVDARPLPIHRARPPATHRRA